MFSAVSHYWQTLKTWVVGGGVVAIIIIIILTWIAGEEEVEQQRIRKNLSFMDTLTRGWSTPARKEMPKKMKGR